MILSLLILLTIFWFFVYVHIPPFLVPDITLLVINGQAITLWNLLIFFVISVIIGILPNPFRSIASVFLTLWVLALFSILTFSGMSSIMILAIIVGLLAYLISGIGTV